MIDPPFASLDELLALLQAGGDGRYAGESVTHWEHASQTAALALQARAAPSLVVAALLHDVGHWAPKRHGPGAATPTLEGVDDQHEIHGSRRLETLFHPEVTEPIWLHVAAKRYLVTRSKEYRSRLSEDSLRSLSLQGGAMSAAEATAFKALPHAEEALRLRAWDDLAKHPDAPVQRFERFLPLLESQLRVTRPSWSGASMAAIVAPREARS